jgi:TIR domain-containing protein
LSDWAPKLSSLAKEDIQGWTGEMIARLYKNLDYLCDKPTSGRHYKDIDLWSHEDSAKPIVEIIYKIDKKLRRINVQKVSCMIALAHIPEEDVFLSYSRKDSYWFENLGQTLRDQLEALRIHLWSDKEIPHGQTWLAVIQEKVSGAKAALLLVSESFLQSEFICEHELSRFLERREDPSGKPFLLLWVPLTHKRKIAKCDLGRRVLEIQALHDASQPLRRFRGKYVMDSRVLPLTSEAFRTIYRHCRGLPL